MIKSDEDKHIGDLKGRFVRKNLRSQVLNRYSASEASGNIALAYYRGIEVGRKQVLDEIKRKKRRGR